MSDIVLSDKVTNIKLVFLPKNTTSRLQSLDPDIIRKFKLKYRKLLLRFVVSCVNNSQTASEIIEEVHILRAISWLQTVWKSVTREIIKNCFRKRGFDVENNCEVINDRIDAEFQELFDQLSLKLTSTNTSTLTIKLLHPYEQLIC